jgi:hypothetical protein
VHPFGAAIEAGDVDAAVALLADDEARHRPGRRFRGNAGMLPAAISRDRTRELPGKAGTLSCAR